MSSAKHTWQDPRGRAPARVNPPSGPTFGDVVSATHRPTSKIEQSVTNFLRGAGFQIAKGPMGVVCHHPDEGRRTLTLTPDIVLRDLWLAIEVDPCRPAERYGHSHAGSEDKDRLRNDLLAAVGWTVIRLRLDAGDADYVGARDVTVESSGFTRAAQQPLLDAINDYVHQRPAVVRHVRKGKRPQAAQRRSHVVNIGLDQYSDDTYWCTWFPDLESPSKYRLRLAANGRYLYAPSGRGAAFVAEIDLHNLDRSEWKDRLTEYLATRTPEDLLGTTKWPWGDTLLLPANPSDPIAADIIYASDHEKQTIDRVEFWFTISGDHVDGWSPDALHRSDGIPIVAMHADAIAAGYRFADVDLGHGYRGPYQRVTITRAQPDRT